MHIAINRENTEVNLSMMRLHFIDTKVLSANYTRDYNCMVFTFNSVSTELKVASKNRACDIGTRPVLMKSLIYMIGSFCCLKKL